MKHTIHRTLKRMTFREKALLLLFVLVILFFWSGSLINRYGANSAARTLAHTELTDQAQWIERSDFYADGLARALERVDPSKTYSGPQLSGRIDALLRQSGLAGAADIDPVRTREGEIFNDHDLRIRLNRVTIAQLIQFNQLLIQESPYINLQSLRLKANRRQREELDVRIEVNSFDLKNETTTPQI